MSNFHKAPSPTDLLFRGVELKQFQSSNIEGCNLFFFWCELFSLFFCCFREVANLCLDFFFVQLPLTPRIDGGAPSKSKIKDNMLCANFLTVRLPPQP